MNIENACVTQSHLSPSFKQNLFSAGVRRHIDNHLIKMMTLKGKLLSSDEERF